MGSNQKTLYVVGVVKESNKISLPFIGEHNLKLTWPKGMVGVVPVFDSEEAAEKYAGGELQILKLSAKDGYQGIPQKARLFYLKNSMPEKLTLSPLERFAQTLGL